MKTQKGITLIALIITIVVLLILAVVAIRAVQGNGIIAYAQNAATGYNQAQKNESDRLQAYLNIMDDAQNKINNATNPVKLIKFKIDFSHYNERYEGVVKEYTAVEGMTWEQWMDNEEYCTYGSFGTWGTDVNISPDGGTAGNCFLQKYIPGDSNEHVVLLEDVIIEGYTYHTWGC